MVGDGQMVRPGGRLNSRMVDSDSDLSDDQPTRQCYGEVESTCWYARMRRNIWLSEEHTSDSDALASDN